MVKNIDFYLEALYPARGGYSHRSIEGERDERAVAKTTRKSKRRNLSKEKKSQIFLDFLIGMEE